MTTDHRFLPGITFAPAPGPLRVGDYYLNLVDKVAHVEQADIDFFGESYFTVAGARRVIPHVRPLEVPEPTTIDSLDELEVCNAISEATTAEWLLSSDAVILRDGYITASGMEYSHRHEDVDDIRNVAAASRGAR